MNGNFVNKMMEIYNKDDDKMSLLSAIEAAVELENTYSNSNIVFDNIARYIGVSKETLIEYELYKSLRESP